MLFLSKPLSHVLTAAKISPQTFLRRGLTTEPIKKHVYLLFLLRQFGTQMKLPFPKFGPSYLSEEDQMTMDRSFVSSFLFLI